MVRPKRRKTVETVEGAHAAANAGPSADTAGSSPSAAASVAAVLAQASTGGQATRPGDNSGALGARFSQLFAGTTADASDSGLSQVLAGLSSQRSSSSASSGGVVSAQRAAAPADHTRRSKGSDAAVGATADRAAEAAATKRKAVGVEGDSKASTAPETKRRLSEEEQRERDGKTLFVGNVPLKWEKKQLRQALRAAVGDKYTGIFKPIWFRAVPLEDKWSHKMRKVGSILGAYNEHASDAKNAYVVLASPEDVSVVSRAVHGCKADERHVLRADGVGEAAKLVNFDRKRSVFVGNLPSSTAEADLREVFASIGSIDAVRVIRDRTTKACKGFAFVRFVERGSVKAALEYWGAEVKGRAIRVMKVERPPGEEDASANDKVDSDHPAARRIAMRNLARRMRTSKAKKRERDARGAKASKSKNKAKSKTKKAQGKKKNRV